MALIFPNEKFVSCPEIFFKLHVKDKAVFYSYFSLFQKKSGRTSIESNICIERTKTR